MSAKKSSQVKQKTGKLVHMSFVVSEDLRNTFKGKVSTQGKKMQEVLEELMREYIKRS
jgi:hypothetical protein